MIEITNISDATENEWYHVCKESPIATYFHTPRWAMVFKQYIYRTCRVSPQKISFNDGVEVLVPLVKTFRLHGVLRNNHLSPLSTYGGWLSVTRLSDEHIDCLVSFLYSLREFVWRENPFDATLVNRELSFAHDDFTMVIDLRKGEDHIYRQTTHAHRKAIKKAHREGVSIRKATKIEEWHEYFAIYQKSLERWRKAGREKKTRVIYTWELFRGILETKTKNEDLWIGTIGDKIVAGIVCFYWNHHVVTWHGAALHEYFSQRPNNLLYWEIILDACKKGYWWFDFNPSGGYRGVVDFKAQFGAKPLRARLIEKRSPIRNVIALFRKK